MNLNLHCLVAPAALALCSGAAQAALVFYNSEAAFDLAAGTVVTQTFAQANDTTCGVLNNTTAGCGFAVGQIAAGLNITATGTQTEKLYGSRPGSFFGHTNGAVFANVFTETLNLGFAGGVGAVGLGLLSISPDVINISFFDGADVLLGSTSVTANILGRGTFFGVTGSAGERISRINLSSTNNNAEGIDLVKFGAGNQVPVPGTLALAGLAMLCLGAARRRWS